MPKHDTPSVDQYKRNAARLLKAAHAGDADALRRFAVLENSPSAPQLKHALAAIAREAGHDNWAALKRTVEGPDFSEVFAAPGLGDTLNAWFSTYEEAKSHLAAAGGVLLPYRHQFFVTSKAILGRLGFEPDHPDWRDIAYDFVRPASAEAHARLCAALRRRFAARS